MSHCAFFCQVWDFQTNKTSKLKFVYSCLKRNRKEFYFLMGLIFSEIWNKEETKK